jgi:heme oxygenase (mycobilin-producing)
VRGKRIPTTVDATLSGTSCPGVASGPLGPDDKAVRAVAEPLVLINAFEVPAADAERFIAAWERTRDYLMSQAGYVDTALHQAVTPNADFQFVNMGRWQTMDDFLSATQSSGFREAAADLAGYRTHPGLYRIVRT